MMETQNRFERARAWLSALGDRASLSGQMNKPFSGERDYYETLGYRREVDFPTYLEFFKRGDVASKIISLPPDTTWREKPEVQSEDEAFVEAVEVLDRRVRLFHNMSKVDEIGGIGRFGVLVFGTANESVEEAPQGSPGTGDPEKLGYLQAYHEGSVDVDTYDKDRASPRFGLPDVYKINFGSEGNATGLDARVPWQRVIHFAEKVIEGRVFGTPRLEKVINRLDDLNKVVGSSAELFWQIVAGVWHVDISPDVTATDAEKEALEEHFLEARFGLRQLLQTTGAELNRVAGDVPDPAGVYEAIIQLTAAGAEIPERVLFGSERGELASTQDQREWYGRIAGRQENIAEPLILRPTLDRFIGLGILPTPKDGYEVFWPPLDAPTTEEKAETFMNIAKGVKDIAPAGASELVIAPWEAREMLELPAAIPESPEGWDNFSLPSDGEGGEGDEI